MPPTYDTTDAFAKDFSTLTAEQGARFRKAVGQFVDDLGAGRLPRPGLRVKRVQGTASVWELSWAPDGRATFERGDAVVPGEAHIVWRRIGTHVIFKRP